MGRKKKLTTEQAIKILIDWFAEHGIAPTIDQFRLAAGLKSLKTAFVYLEQMRKEGFIERWPGARGLRLLKVPGVGLETVALPIIGTAPAGPLMIAEENREGWVKLPKELLGPQSAKYFLLRVNGDSMNKCRVAGGTIESGDLVIVRQEAAANPGDVVVALLDGQATIKRLSKVQGTGYIILKPESSNPKNKPIPVLLDKDFGVQGVVTRVLKGGMNVLEHIEE